MSDLPIRLCESDIATLCRIINGRIRAGWTLDSIWSERIWRWFPWPRMATTYHAWLFHHHAKRHEFAPAAPSEPHSAG